MKCPIANCLVASWPFRPARCWTSTHTDSTDYRSIKSGRAINRIDLVRAFPLSLLNHRGHAASSVNQKV
jgi:hypothetical protein